MEVQHNKQNGALSLDVIYNILTILFRACLCYYIGAVLHVVNAPLTILFMLFMCFFYYNVFSSKEFKVTHKVIILSLFTVVFLMGYSA